MSHLQFSREDLRFAARTVVWLLLTHAVVFFLHEYSHSFVAWMLGWKDDPLALEYGHPDLSNLLLQQQIDENVDYDPIFAAGHGYQAAAVGLAGVLFGNALVYLAVHWGLTRFGSRLGPNSTLFLFWTALMAAANCWSYAPVRTVTTHADMFTAARGLGLPTWGMLPLVSLPSVAILWACFARLLPLVTDTLLRLTPARSAFVRATASSIVFAVFGAVAIGGNYGDVSAVFSILSIFLVQPLVTMALLSGSAPSGEP